MSKKPQNTARDREIARLRQSLEAERRHAAELEREVAALREELRRRPADARDKPLRRLRRRARYEDRLRDAASRRAQNYRRGSFLRYLFEAMMDSLPVQVIAQLLHYLRRLRVFNLILALVLAVGAVILVTVLSAAALPFLLFGTATLGILAWMRSRRMNAILREALDGRHIRVLVTPSRNVKLGENSFFVRQARAMAQEEGVAVIVVSPYIFSRKGLGGRGRYFTAREEAPALYLVRRHYFFVLRKRVLDVVDADMTVIY